MSSNHIYKIFCDIKARILNKDEHSHNILKMRQIKGYSTSTFQNLSKVIIHKRGVLITRIVVISCVNNQKYEIELTITHPWFFPKLALPFLSPLHSLSPYSHRSILGLNGSNLWVILTGCVTTFSSSNFRYVTWLISTKSLVIPMSFIGEGEKKVFVQYMFPN